MEVIEIDHPLVHIFTVRAFAAVFEEKLNLFVHCPKDFPCKIVVSGDSIFVDDVVLGNLCGKILELNRQDAFFSKNKLAGHREGFDLKEEGVEIWETETVVLADALMSSMFFINPSFCAEETLIRRDLFLLLPDAESAFILLKENGEKAPGADLCALPKFPAQRFVDTPLAKTTLPIPASSNSWWSWMLRPPWVLEL